MRPGHARIATRGRLDPNCTSVGGVHAVEVALSRWRNEILLGMLERLSHRDRGSQEMLHFDYQMRAVKVR
jgi:hypothetical protein